MNLSEYMNTQHTRNPFWIWAHIDDDGPRWFLAVLGSDRDEDGDYPTVWFVQQDFEDSAEAYEDREVVELVPPAAPQRKALVISATSSSWL